MLMATALALGMFAATTTVADAAQTISAAWRRRHPTVHELV
jgi:hypothetical protein